jgi:hypothetical protein
LLNSDDIGKEKMPITNACNRLTELGGAKIRATSAEQLTNGQKVDRKKGHNLMQA